MNRTSLCFLIWLGTGWSITKTYGQSDSVRTEITQERTPIDSVHRPNPERDETEKKQLNEFFRRSRREVTLVEIGVAYPIGKAGVYLFNDPRPGIEQTNLFSLWVGGEHKLTPAWAVMGGVDWQFSPKTAKANVLGTSWLGQVGLNY